MKKTTIYRILIVALAGIGIAIGLVFFNNTAAAITGICIVVLPFAVYYAYNTWMNIPEKEYPVWYPSENETPFLPATVHPMQVQVQITRRPGESSIYVYPVTTSAKTKLERLFESLVAAKNGIEIQDASGRKFGWQFYEQKWFGFYKRYLNPSVSLMANNINSQAKIIIVRAMADN